MAKPNDEYEGDEMITLDNLKQNLNAYSFKKLRKLVVVLIDSLSELSNKKNFWNNSLDIF